MTAKDRKTRIRQSIDAINSGDIERFFSPFAPDCIFHDRPAAGISDLESAREGAKTALTNFPDLFITIEDIITEGDKIVVRYMHRGTHAPTGTKVIWTGISILHYVDDMIVEDWANTDLLGLMQQIGAIPVPE